MGKIFQFISVRFPIGLALLFSLGYSFLAMGLASHKNTFPWTTHFSSNFFQLILLSSVFFFFLLRQRIVDEFKDFEHDSKNYPDRPVPLGVISKTQLLALGIFALFVEVFSVILLGVYAIITYFFVFLYSLLMAKEFFISHWLKKHFTVYFLIHEVIFLLYGIFFVLVLHNGILNSTIDTLAILTILVLTPVSIKIIRKFSPRYNKSGEVVHDTYGTVWGRSNAVYILIFLSIIVGGLLMLHTYSFLPVAFSFLMSLTWLIFEQKSDNAVIVIGAINFIGFSVLSNYLN